MKPLVTVQTNHVGICLIRAFCTVLDQTLSVTILSIPSTCTPTMTHPRIFITELSIATVSSTGQALIILCVIPFITRQAVHSVVVVFLAFITVVYRTYFITVVAKVSMLTAVQADSCCSIASKASSFTEITAVHTRVRGNVPELPRSTIRTVNVVIGNTTAHTIFKITILLITSLSSPANIAAVEAVAKPVTFSLIYFAVLAAVFCTACTIFTRFTHSAGLIITIPETFHTS